ncbi:MAG: flavodoxin-dependent (E)-4-hydroxy-3-methylbut-2-enyl-diphosphate synthase [bacterium]
MIKKTKQIKVGQLLLGGGAPVLVQSMCNTDTRDVESTVRQIEELTEAGCEIIRVAVPDREAASALSEIKKRITLPLVADIHFSYQLALEAIKNGVDALRINPGNIGGQERVRLVVKAAKERSIPIRIGVNAGSLEKDILARYQGLSPEALVESALNHVRILEDEDFTDIVISVKASDIQLMQQSYRLLSAKVSYPLHLGVTEAGTVFSGTIKSAIGIGSLLAEGIGDTIRVSLTGSPAEEVRVAYQILKSLHLRKRGPEIISCPTCGRTQVNLIPLAEEIERRAQRLTADLKIAVMGCAVNGPGEAKEADIGIAGGKGEYLLFKKGQVMKKLSEENIADSFWHEIKQMAEEEK